MVGKPLGAISLLVVANVVGVINFDFTPPKYVLGNFQILFIPVNVSTWFAVPSRKLGLKEISSNIDPSVK